jgi:hypothetical protein
MLERLKGWNKSRKLRVRRRRLIEELDCLYALRHHIDRREPELVNEVEEIDRATPCALR